MDKLKYIELPNKDFTFQSIDTDILNFWDKENIFQELLKINRNKPLWTFLDGPPFVNGSPHSGHVLVSFVKDTVIRYKSMEGYYVPRTIGYDCHGLPLEQAAEKEIGINTKDDIMKYGIANYNNVCRDIIQKCSDQWEKCFHRLGRWVDVKNKYKTMDTSFMESEWWAFKVLFQKGLVYKGFKIMPYSYACTTVLSNFEANSNYKDVMDQTATVTFPILDNSQFANTSMIAWTTTPWTLPSNLALCVNPELKYLKVWDIEREHFFIIGEDLLDKVYGINKKKKVENVYKIDSSYMGAELVGLKYKPLFDYFTDENYFRILGDRFVKNEAGTGTVHLAPAFGEDDFRVCIENNVTKKNGDRLVCPVDDSGRFTSQVYDYQKRNVKECDKDIIKELKIKGRLFAQSPYKHSYPHCWRTDKPLIYKCIDCWFINVEAIKPDLLQNNLKTEWIPNYVKVNRFHNWLENAKDWCVSRSRYWGTPIPIWMSDDGEEIVCIGSIDELKELTGVDKITDLHREFVDNLEIPSKMGKGMLKKIPDVFDCWYESGLCGLASLHYPFENKEYFEENLPIDFITESLDQTRGWFYTLMVLSTALFNKPAFKNVIVTGLILASDGKKMSKRLMNYTDPMLLVDKYGSDPLRLYLISSPVVRAEPYAFQDKGVEQITRKLLPWFNGYKFFTECYTRFSKIYPESDINLIPNSDNITDIWIKEKLNDLVGLVREEMKQYKLYNILDNLIEFIDQLTNWYIKLNRDRLKGIYSLQDKQINVLNWEQSLKTLFDTLLKFAKVMAPFTPFFCEYLYSGLSKLSNNTYKSIHLNPYPNYEVVKMPYIIRQMSRMQNIIDLLRKLKLNESINLSTPVRKVTVCHSNSEWRDDIKYLQEYIKSETSIIDFVINDIAKYANFTIQPLNGAIGKIFKKNSSDVISLIKNANINSLDLLSYNDVLITSDYYEIIPILKHNLSDPFLLENGILVIMDKTRDQEVILLDEINRFRREIQILRKDSGLHIWNSINIYYKDIIGKLSERINKYPLVLKEMSVSDFCPYSDFNTIGNIIAEKDLVIDSHQIHVKLTHTSK